MLGPWDVPYTYNHVWGMGYSMSWRAFLWEDPDQDFWLVAFLSSKSFFRSVIYRILSRQGFIGSLIWVICKRIMGSIIRHVPLDEGSEINHCVQRFWSWITYTSYTSHLRRTYLNFPAFVSICVEVSGLNLNLFLPIIEWKSSDNRQSASEIQISQWVVQNFVSVLPRKCRITPRNTRECNLHDGTPGLLS